MKVKLFAIGGKILTNKYPFPQVNCLQILVESPSILSLQIFATGSTFLTFNQTHYERNDLIDWIAFEVCNAKTYELFMSTNVYKRFDPRVMEREELIGINRGSPTMIQYCFPRNFKKNEFAIEKYIFLGPILFSPKYIPNMCFSEINTNS